MSELFARDMITYPRPEGSKPLKRSDYIVKVTREEAKIILEKVIDRIKMDLKALKESRNNS